ncbi:MAG: deoxynucleoside kinase [Anaerolineae bacterium]
MRQNLYLAIEGAIGVGKTTLARLIQKEFAAQLLLEVFEENPFLRDFYADRERYAFQTQIFFLLSRYRQQHETIPRLIRRSPLISDYTFAKDRLFAHLNLKGDELDMYERVHAILAEKIPLPHLVVYLRADTDVLMERIAFRDRPYERDMDRGYIDALNRAYDGFFAAYAEAPVLPIDTNELNFVSRPEDLDFVVQRIKSALGTGVHQRPLPQLGLERPPQLEGARTLADFQPWPLALSEEQGVEADPYLTFIRLQEAMGDLASELAEVWATMEQHYQETGDRMAAQRSALQERLPGLREELADCLTHLFNLANYVGIDLEEARQERSQALTDERLD